MKPDIPYPPCPAPTAAKACFSSHKRCTIERLSLSLSLPLILLFLPGPHSASRQGEMPTSPQSRAECPRPLFKCFTTSPTTHTFILCTPLSPSPPFLHLFIFHLTLQSLQHFFPFLYSILLLQFYMPFSGLLLLHSYFS